MHTIKTGGVLVVVMDSVCSTLFANAFDASLAREESQVVDSWGVSFRDASDRALVGMKAKPSPARAKPEIMVMVIDL